MSLLSVAIPRHVEGLFTYLLPEHLKDRIRVGSCVTVPFGKSKTHAFVIQEPQGLDQLPKDLPPEKLKEILDVQEEEEIFLPPDVLALCRFAADYYHAPLGEVLNCAVPPASLKAKGKRRAKIDAEAKENAPGDDGIAILPPLRIELTENQKNALAALEQIRTSPPKAAQPKVALLQGITGSGKTELYLELARRTLAEGKNVLLLVPEIALTPQLHHRFERGLGIRVGLWHSALAAGRRREESVLLRAGKLRAIVGARSAIFAPIQNLGLLVVDEEHDPSYKQQDRAKYHARDLAVVRAKITGAFVVLGSATPSLESRERVLENRYGLATLSERPNASASGGGGSSSRTGAGLPDIEIVNLCEEEKVENVQAPLAHKTLAELQQTIADGNQALIFLNRRGFASFLVCEECGEVPGCENCSISLTVHRRFGRLRCHVCSFEKKIPLLCPKCQGTKLKAMGAGTESLEEELPALIPGAKPLRLDRDQVTSATRLNTILNTFRDGHANLLLGTQMLVKGHDFPNVTLVVVILADSLFRWPDFRAPERAYQILTQVAGRAGRGVKKGKVLIQAYQATNPVLRAVRGEISEADFLTVERDLRKALTYPPFGRLARIRFESKHQEEAERRAKTAAHCLIPFIQNNTVSLLGPSEAFLERAKGIYRWDLLLKSKEIGSLQKAIATLRALCAHHKWQSAVDMDPYGVG